MQGQDTRIFNGVMDQDSAPFTIDQSNVRYRLNLVNLYNENGFASNENIQGFEVVSNSYLTSIGTPEVSPIVDANVIPNITTHPVTTFTPYTIFGGTPLVDVNVQIEVLGVTFLYNSNAINYSLGVMLQTILTPMGFIVDTVLNTITSTTGLYSGDQLRITLTDTFIGIIYDNTTLFSSPSAVLSDYSLTVTSAGNIIYFGAPQTISPVDNLDIILPLNGYVNNGLGIYSAPNYAGYTGQSLVYQITDNVNSVTNTYTLSFTGGSPAIVANVNKCIGAFEDVKGNSIIYFVYSEDKHHGIYRWYQNRGGLNGLIEKIYQVQDVNNDCLNFDKEKRISHCSLADDLLIWAEENNPPKALNIVKANTTNKKREFNIYFDYDTLGVNKTFTLNVYSSTNYSFTWTSFSSNDTIEKVVLAFVNQAMLDNTLIQIVGIKNNIKYATVTIFEVGDYYLDIVGDAVAIADNFYPDITPTASSYSALSSEQTTLVKYPPKYPLKTEYTNIDPLNKMDVLSQTAVTHSSAPNYTYGSIGLYNNSVSPYFDNIGVSVLGANNLSIINVFATPVWAATATGLRNNTSNPITIDLTLNLTFSKVFSGAFNLTLGKFVTSTTQPSDYTIATSAPTLTVIKNITITIPALTTFSFYVGTQVTNLTFSIDIIGAEVNTYIQKTSITRTAYLFRAKYIYSGDQKSVYGAVSRLSNPSNQYQDGILVDYSDPRISSKELVSDIKNVVLSVSEDNGTTWYDFKTLEPYEFIGSNTYLFTGKESYIAVPPSEAILPYHNVPLTAKSSEYIDDRIFMGAIVTGYDKIEVKADLSHAILTPTNTGVDDTMSFASWKRGGKYNIGIVYYDNADRRSAVNRIGTIDIPYYNDVMTLYPSSVNIDIYNPPPAWATKYHIVRSDELTQTSFLLFLTDKREFIDDENNVTASTSAPYIRISLANIAEYTDNFMQGTQIAFPYVNGSRVRFIKKVSAGYYPYNDFEVLRVDGTDIYLDNTNNTLGTLATGDLIEIYTPRLGTDTTNYYEFGYCFDIEESTFNGITSKYHKGNTQDQYFGFFGAQPTPAKLILENGDVFYRNRNMPYSTAPILYSEIYISSNTPSDYTSTIFNGNGRVNSTELLGQVYQPTGVVFTNRYISGTKINGLNAVEAANTRQYSTIYGDLNKMQVVNNDVLKFIFGNGYQLSIYVNQGVIRQTGGASNLISIYDDVAGNSHLIQRTLGTQNAESVVLNDEGDVFGWDETEGVDWLSASNATLQVSDYNMKNTFGNYGLQRRRLDNTKSNTPAIYDLYRDLMILTLAPLQPRQFVAPKATVKLADLNGLGWTIQVIVQPQGLTQTYTTPPSLSWYDIVRAALPPSYSMTQKADGSFDISAPDYANFKDSVLILSGQNMSTGVITTMTYPFTGGQEASNEPPFSGVTLAYSRKLKGWVTYFSYLPEMYGRLRNQVASFKDGQLWLHDKSVLSNNFYGVQYPSLLRFVLNKDYPKVKVPLSVWYRGLGSWGSVVRYQPDNMETEMIPAAFRLQENGYAASVTRDRNDPRFTDPQQAWVNGQEVRGDAVEIELYNNDSSQARIDSEKTVYLHSNLS
jgi:hypothetical protein